MKQWFINGVIHREEGPAYIHGDLQVWYLHGIKYTKEQFDYELEKKVLNKKLNSTFEEKKKIKRSKI